MARVHRGEGMRDGRVRGGSSPAIPVDIGRVHPPGVMAHQEPR